MGKFIARRLLSVLPILLGVSIVTFLLMKLIPGDIAQVLLGPYATEETLAALRAYLGLDLPIHLQYIRWLTAYVQGNLGLSIAYGLPVASILVQRVVNSLILTAAALAIAVAVGFGGGTLAATKRFSFVDRSSTMSALILAGTPTFWLGLMLMYVFSLKLGWLPVTGMHTIGKEGSVVDLLRHIPLPALAASANSLATIFRLARSAMLDTLGQGYILAARARGLPERSVVYKHGLRNILATVVNVSALQIGFIFGGALFAEVIFNWPGVGLLMYNSVVARDVPVIQATLLVIAVIFVLANFMSDLVQALIDPRTRQL